MKHFIVALMISSFLVVVAACGSNESSTDTPRESGNGEAKEHNLTLAHNLSEDHPVHLGLARFAELVEERSEGQITMEIFPNGVLGDEREVLEQVQAGGVDITKVSAAALENFSSQYAVFSLPYVFADEEHFFQSMESEAVAQLFDETEADGFVGLTWYDSGARSFYTVDQPIMHPDDLKGLRIRVMDSQTQIEMMEALGGAPTPMPYGEIYTALQSGVVDGAESNPTALTTGKHGEVAKAFSFDEHARIPDIAVISSAVWNEFTDEQRQFVRDAAKESTEYQKDIWAEAVEEAIEEAEAMGVEFHYPDQEPFYQAVQPLHEKYREDEKIAELLDAFDQMRQ
ncbi:TRAP transporter substrate-binding protein [Halalkalibacterium halodurans]|uniref:C4-dicarboxylate transport system (C4-dicarboxylate-binding protein) n=1 Tax=Halalkalibacterium halodurans (strain ATCC BAA-125 / DSM 18197 / FERM 7344 / JCM 9153 / C-125) TaxID=272558 RepID=Q9KEZ8_HALH5|nr:TRAP transporter substrate-binding protein [Halalkalibacterium halodurans]MED4080327.1 TRAP transporter substrate-binding protein [Halalkalibacterium halodurans]MED4084609.1 TRAP transporter substrate-binding protein [Halalkalibacterium halodurans]MED4104827.1 TRAP transporter substrate-binding protein [Halalkalibacterium halodurans]MED4109732.1 TRAP transporter substrate-binding protein [Halalkalibacterium halodurans]MED4147923.1 TRAP transporter substrate-binding protein [Halalkalibacteri